MRRFISMLMMVFVVAAMTALSAMPAFAGGHDGGNNAGGSSVKCKLNNQNIVQVANVQACLAIGGVVVDVL